MSTQYDKLKSLFTEFDLGFSEKEGEILVSGNNPTNKAIVCEKDIYDKVGGYIGFSCEFVFDKDGNFIQLNCWE